MIITIDGPSASGKTTIARMLARKLGFYYLSSGLLFRGLAYVLVHEFNYKKSDLQNPQKKDILAALNPETLVYAYDRQNGEQLFFNTKNITNFLRDEETGQDASMIATSQIVRDELIRVLHHIADSHDLIAEGRDMGTIVFAQADVKFYLTASLEVRAGRFLKDQAKRGTAISFQEACHYISSKDQRDMSREIAPLSISKGAIVIDDSDLSQAETMSAIEHEIQRRTIETPF